MISLISSLTSSMSRHWQKNRLGIDRCSAAFCHCSWICLSFNSQKKMCYSWLYCAVLWSQCPLSCVVSVYCLYSNFCICNLMWMPKIKHYIDVFLSLKYKGVWKGFTQKETSSDVAITEHWMTVACSDGRQNNHCQHKVGRYPVKLTLTLRRCNWGNFQKKKKRLTNKYTREISMQPEPGMSPSN